MIAERVKSRMEAVEVDRIASGIRSAFVVIAVVVTSLAFLFVLDRLWPSRHRRNYNEVFAWQVNFLGMTYGVIISFMLLAAWASFSDAILSACLFGAENFKLHAIQVSGLSLLIALSLAAIADLSRPYQGAAHVEPYGFVRAQETLKSPGPMP